MGINPIGACVLDRTKLSLRHQAWIPWTRDRAMETDRQPVEAELNFRQATYTQRHNWVLGCYDYAYTGRGAEHQECDAQFQPDGSRLGTASLTFVNVPPGRYNVFVGRRHTENRNPAGARFLVNGQVSIIDQRIHSPDRVWDLHGRHCLFVWSGSNSSRLHSQWWV